MTTGAAPTSGVPYAWSAATLLAARKEAGLSQAVLADLAGIDRSRYIALEKGRHKLSLTYAERLAPHLKKPVAELLPPAEDATDPEDPYALLRRLVAAVDRQQETIDELAAKVAALERAGRSRRPASRGGR